MFNPGAGERVTVIGMLLASLVMVVCFLAFISLRVSDGRDVIIGVPNDKQASSFRAEMRQYESPRGYNRRVEPENPSATIVNES